MFITNDIVEGVNYTKSSTLFNVWDRHYDYSTLNTQMFVFLSLQCVDFWVSTHVFYYKRRSPSNYWSLLANLVSLFNYGPVLNRRILFWNSPSQVSCFCYQTQIGDARITMRHLDLLWTWSAIDYFSFIAIISLILFRILWVYFKVVSQIYIDF